MNIGNHYVATLECGHVASSTALPLFAPKVNSVMYCFGCHRTQKIVQVEQRRVNLGKTKKVESE